MTKSWSDHPNFRKVRSRFFDRRPNRVCAFFANEVDLEVEFFFLARQDSQNGASLYGITNNPADLMSRTRRFSMQSLVVIKISRRQKTNRNAIRLSGDRPDHVTPEPRSDAALSTL